MYVQISDDVDDDDENVNVTYTAHALKAGRI